MSYTTIMVHQELDGVEDARLGIAVDLARRFDARLIGVAACAVNPPAYGRGAFTAAIVADLQEQTENQLRRAAERVRDHAEGKAREIGWRQAFEKPTGYVARQARAADLIVTGAIRDGGYLDPFTRLDPGELIMQAGRPVLIVPPQAVALSGNHIVVAWKDTREARRAVLDALPLLQAATDVTIAEVTEPESLKDATRSGEDLAAWLKSHGVCAAGHALVSTEEPAAALEGLLQQNAADLIVAGAYGHSRLQEWIFGGVTRDLLTSARCCCLLSN